MGERVLRRVAVARPGIDLLGAFLGDVAAGQPGQDRIALRRQCDALHAGRADDVVHADDLVEAGESLQDVAHRVAPDAPTRQVVERIRELNDLNSPAVAAGQTLIAPVG